MYEYTEYKGKKIIVLKKRDDEKYPFSFGQTKAKLIVDHFKEIEKFAKESSGKQETL